MRISCKTLWLILILLVGWNTIVLGVVQEKKEGHIKTQFEPESKKGKLKEIKKIWKELKKRAPKKNKKKSDDTLLIIFLVLLGIVMCLALIAAIVFVISCFFKALFDGYCLH